MDVEVAHDCVTRPRRYALVQSGDGWMVPSLRAWHEVSGFAVRFWSWLLASADGRVTLTFNQEPLMQPRSWIVCVASAVISFGALSAQAKPKDDEQDEKPKVQKHHHQEDEDR